MKTRALFGFLLLCASACAKTPEVIDPTLIKGTPADPKEWPASVYASMGNARCSATVVSENVLLIASHCVSHGGTASFSVGANQYSARCSHGPEYPANSTADWTLCKIDRAVAGIPYEAILTDTKLMDVGKSVQLTGYGCVQPGGGGGNDGIFRIGTANIMNLPSGRDYDTVTQGAALCFGDSGGAAYVWDGENRYIFGVNSRGNIRDTSYLASTYVNTFQDFAKRWSSQNGVKICGIDPQAMGCRGGQKATPPSEFTFDTPIASGQVKVKPGKEGLLERVKAAILAALAVL